MAVSVQRCRLSARGRDFDRRDDGGLKLQCS